MRLLFRFGSAAVDGRNGGELWEVVRSFDSGLKGGGPVLPPWVFWLVFNRGKRLTGVNREI